MAAPKGNKNALGNDGGHPPIHTDPKEVEKLIDEYFHSLIELREPPTVTGLALYLGFADKSSVYDYSKKIEFSHSIKRATMRIEKYHEIQTARGDKCTGNIFVLKNFGWKDTQAFDHTTGGKEISSPAILFKKIDE